jgi:hypothetical protein
MSSQTYMSMTKQAKQATQAKQNRECSPSPDPNHEGKYNKSKIIKGESSFRVPSRETYFFDRCNQPMAEICEETNYFQLIPDNFKNAMFKFICEQSRIGPSVYGQYSAPPDRESTDWINGKGGYFLKKTAEEANIYLIWHNRQKNIYKFWGASEHEVRDAMNRLRGRIVKYVIHVPIAKVEHAKVEHAKVEHAKVEHAKVQHVKVKRREPIQLNKENLSTTPPPSPKAGVYFKPIACEVSNVQQIKHWSTEEDNCPPQLMRSISVAPFGFASDEEYHQPIGLTRSMSIVF